MHALRLIGTVALVMAYGSASADPNLLHNGDFSNASQLDGWAVTKSVASWNGEDAAANGASGSIQVLGSATGTIVISYCFAATPGAVYSYGGKYRAVSGGPQGTFSCAGYSTEGCIGSPAEGLGSAEAIPGNAVWTSLTPFSGTLGAQDNFVQCRLDANSGGIGGSFLFDDLFFDSATPLTPVGLESFDVR